MYYVGAGEWLRSRECYWTWTVDYAQVERDLGAWLRRTTSEIPHDEIQQ
jgi:hypothetical protein